MKSIRNTCFEKMAWNGQQPPPFNPSYNPNFTQQGGNPSAPPPPQSHPYNAYQPGGYGTPGYGSQPPQTQYGAPPRGYGAPPAGGYGAPGYGTASPAPPPGADPTLWYWFQAVDANHSNSITATELRQALVNGNWSPFNEETCRLMIGMFDTDRDGTINFQEFAALWKYIQDWKQCFERFDTDRSGNIDANELANAFRTFGYNLSPQFSHMIVRKFDRASRNTINFDDFIQCCVMLKSLTDAFRRKDTSMRGTIQIHYEEFLEMVLENAMH